MIHAAYDDTKVIRLNDVPTPAAPWLSSKDPEVPANLEYTSKTMSAAVEAIAERYPDLTAYEFLGTTATYKELWDQIETTAKALKAVGIREGDRVTVCMPNTPQTVCIFYAINLVGAIATMIHPLSAESEIAFYLRDSGSIAAITLDQFYPKFKNVMKAVDLQLLLITSVADVLGPLMKIGYKLTAGRKIAPVPHDAPHVLFWKTFLSRGKHTEIFRVRRKAEDPAVILYSGGTTGTFKGILLSNLNFNALAAQIVATNPFFRAGDKMLAVMPMFHGFGLGVSIHSMFANGGQCILIPRFNAKTYGEMLEKYKPNLIAGVPSLFEALLRNWDPKDLKLDFLKGVFSGGDSLSISLKKRLDKFLSDHGAKITVREGYGTTECVTACCLTPIHKQKEGSIGIPFPDTYFRIVEPGTDKEVPYGTEGEITLTGPSVMLEYINQPEETADTIHEVDGYRWIHTGDLGVMDEEGFVYFRQRIKRMIITNGYNVYPSQMENILDAHEYVQISCVIGVPDPVKIQKIKAFIVLKPGYAPTKACKEELMRYCRKHIAKYALPYDIEFREDLPKTLVGKVAFRVLEEEELAKLKAAQDQAAQDAAPNPAGNAAQDSAAPAAESAAAAGEQDVKSADAQADGVPASGASDKAE